MYFFIGITSILKTFTPYFRKHILDSLESHEYLFLNTFLVAFFVLLYFLYKFLFHDKSLDKLIDKIHNLTLLQVIYFLLIAFITVSSSIVIINFDKYYNTPLINSLLIKGLAAILLILVGVFIYKEKYNYKQLFGIFLTIVGIFLTGCK
jgi:drug/metabolite transporter (DMT)-like permease